MYRLSRSFCFSLKKFTENCFFIYNFQQALIRNIYVIGLKKAYKEDIGTRDVLRKIMALCYIPKEHILPLFNKLKEKCTSPTMTRFATYFEDTWIKSWSIADWCVFLCSICINNTLEGLNNKFNSSCSHNMPFYQLVSKIHADSTFVAFDVNFVYLNLLTQRADPTYAGINQKLFLWWKPSRNKIWGSTKSRDPGSGILLKPGIPDCRYHMLKYGTLKSGF